jgi:hypothetical protein
LRAVFGLAARPSRKSAFGGFNGSGVVAFSSDANGNLRLLKTDGTVTDVDGTTLATGIGFFAYSFSYAGRSGTTYAASSSAAFKHSARRVPKERIAIVLPSRSTRPRPISSGTPRSGISTPTPSPRG